MIYEKVGCEGGYQCNAKRDGTARDWIRPWAQPFEYLYGPNDLPALAANPRSPKKHNDLKPGVGYCLRDAAGTGWTLRPRRCASCFEGQRGRFCEFPKKAWCLRDCSGHGRCDAGFCWCERGWFGVDCSQTLARADRVADDARRRRRFGGGGPPAEAAAGAYSAAAASALPHRGVFALVVAGAAVAGGGALRGRMYVYEMPHTFGSTRSLQYRTSAGMGVSTA